MMGGREGEADKACSSSQCHAQILYIKHRQWSKIFEANLSSCASWSTFGTKERSGLVWHAKGMSLCKGLWR